MSTSPAVRANADGILAVALCCLAMTCEGFDLQAPGVTARVLAASFGLTPAQQGIFLSSSTFGMMIGALSGGRLSDRFGRKWVLIGAIAVFSSLSIVTALSTSGEMLLAARFATGIGLGGALPNLIALAAESVTPARRSTAVGFLLAGPPVGGALVSLVAAIASGPDQWPIIYYVGGIVPLLLVVPCLATFLPNRQIERTAETGARRNTLTILFGEGRAARTLVIWLAFFTVLLVLFIMLTWLPSLMVTRGLSRPQASLVQMTFNLCAIPGNILIGLLLDRTRHRGLAVTIIFCAAGTALGFLAGGPGTAGMMLLAGALAGVAVTGAQTAVYTLAPSCYPASGRGTGVGFCVAVGRFGSAGGPLVTGFLVGAGQTPTQVLLILLPIIALAGAAAVFVAWSIGASARIADEPAIVA
ncbi:3-(3-hydroxy-phenyl)propionate transporter MhpT [soil metagenome]